MKKKLFVTYAILFMYSLFSFASQSQAKGINSAQTVPVPAVGIVEGPTTNVMVVNSFLSNYMPYGPVVAQPATPLFTDDAEWSHFLFSIAVTDSPVPKNQLFYIALFYDTSTSQILTANIGTNADLLNAGQIFTYSVSYTSLDVILNRGSTYAVNVYVYPIGPIDVDSLNNNTWHICTFR